MEVNNTFTLRYVRPNRRAALSRSRPGYMVCSRMSNLRRSRYVPTSWQKPARLLPVIVILNSSLAGCGVSGPGSHPGEATTATAQISQ